MKLKANLCWTLGLSGKGNLVWLLRMALARECLLSANTSHVNLLVENEGLTIVVDATKLKLGAVLNERNLDALLHLPGRDLVTKLLHEELHDVVALGVDDKGSKVINRSLLEVADD